jgi:hypothetical protein
MRTGNQPHSKCLGSRNSRAGTNELLNAKKAAMAETMLFTIGERLTRWIA